MTRTLEVFEMGMAAVSSDPWSGLPDEIAPQIRAEIPELSSSMVSVIQHRLPVYKGSPDGRAIHRGAEHAMDEFVGRMWKGDGSLASAAEVHRAIGRAERAAGRTLDATRSAYLVGARLAWRRWIGIGATARVPADKMYRVADAIFAHIAELAEHASDGYAAADGSAANERHRRKLVTLLLDNAPEDELRTTAAAAGWSWPDTATAVLVEGGPVPAALSGPEVLAGKPADAEASQLLIVPGALGEATRWLVGPSAGRLTVVGTEVPTSGLADSVRLAERTRELVRHGVVAPSPTGIVRAADHLSTAVLFGDPTLVSALTERYLAPLDALTPRQQARMVTTVLAWLACRGGAPEVAKQLRIHPQTVRYRLRQADEVLGARLLRDPAVKLELEMALRSWQLMHPLTDEDEAGV